MKSRRTKMSISRKFLWVISLLFVLFIAACTEDADIDAILELATSQVEIPDEVSASFTLPDSIEIEGFTIDIEWSSSNATYLSASGVVTRPGFSVGNQTVTLTATLSFGEFSTEETFSVTVLALPASTFVVSFESNGGSTVASINVTEGNLVTEPTDPTRAGFTFEGWYVEATLVTPFAFTETVPTAI
jgi:large repetitive protein